MLDLIVRGGSVVDGAGRPLFSADIGVVNDRIVEVGRIVAPARRVIDADGLLVTPGFVDIHTHYDGQASWDSQLAPSSNNGVTSIAMGNCGVGFAPARPEKRDWLISLLEGVEDIPGTALHEGLTWDWESFPDYLDALDRRAFVLDVGAHIPHAPLRAYVMGDRGGQPDERPTEGERDRMAQLVREAMDAGALGFSTSRTLMHRTKAGATIGTLRAEAAELFGICRAVGHSGRGVIQLISDAYWSGDEEFAGTEMDLMAEMARQSRRPISTTVQQTDRAPERWRFMYDRIRGMLAEGLHVRAQVSARAIGGIMGHTSNNNPFSRTLTYQSLQALPFEARMARLRDPAIKRAILAEHSQPLDEPIFNTASKNFARMFRMSDPVDYEPERSSSLLAEAERLGRDPADYAYDVHLEDDGRRLIYMPAVNYAHGDLTAVYEMMNADFALCGLSDGGAHVGVICDATFPTTALALWSRGNKAGRRFPIEKLVHGYTARNAFHVGWRDRGVIAPGYKADLNVIDMAALALPPPEIVYDLPAGGKRMMQRSRGYRFTIKSGVPTFENGIFTGSLPGRLVRGETQTPNN